MSQKRKIIIVGIAASTVFVAAILSFVFDAPEPPDRSLHISYSVTVQNPTNRIIKNASISILGPISKTPNQSTVQVNTDPPYTRKTQDSNYQEYVFGWEILPPFSSKIVIFQCDIDAWRAPVAPEKKHRDLNAYLLAEPFIEVDHPMVKELAAKLKDPSTITTAENMYDWVSQNVTYSGYAKRTRGALYALKRKNGDCTEFATLFVALCRANGIPARVIGGYVCHNSAVLNLGDYHNWAQFHCNGNWQIADPQRKRFMTEQDTYIAFNVVNPSKRDERAIVSGIQGKGIKVRLNR